MNRPNPHIRYRRSVYRRNRIKMTVIITAVCLAVLALILLVVGNIVGDKVEENRESRKPSQSVSESDARRDVPTVNAFPVPLSDDSSRLSTRLTRAAEAGYTHICFDLDSEDGTLLYSSPAAVALGKQATGLDLWSLPDAMKEFDSRGLYAIGVLRATQLSAEDDLVRAASKGYYAALISEALRSGVEDVLVFPSNVSDYAELASLADEVRRLCPDSGSIGLALPPSLLSDAEDTVLFDTLWQAFDYISVDLTTPDGELGTVEYIDSSLGNMLYYLLRYNVRVLLPYSDDTDLMTQMENTAAANGTSNIQFITK